ncbi:TRAP transporter small permease [Alkalicoccus chagannorensis]|uniref:TRAP transporter small permease n=1 Tax=Alkalicoccus chagannorensis TaxID=427072 RepID=UPI00040F7543|nr:TRAP transporter small permease [Alkalicoccus chagannorensis]
MDAIVRSIDTVNRFLRYTIAIILGVMAVVIAYQIFSRFILGTSLGWSEELTRYLMIWLVFLGAAVALRDKSLIGIDMFVDKLPGKAQQIVRNFTYGLMLVFFGFLMWRSIGVIEGVTGQLSPSMRVSMAYTYAAIPVGAFFMMMNAVVVLIEMNRKEEEG